MHRLYLPLTCASTLCDTIRPETLAYRVAEYIAGITPWYSTGLSAFLFFLCDPIIPRRLKTFFSSCAVELHTRD